MRYFRWRLRTENFNVSSQSHEVQQHFKTLRIQKIDNELHMFELIGSIEMIRNDNWIPERLTKFKNAI